MLQQEASSLQCSPVSAGRRQNLRDVLTLCRMWNIRQAIAAQVPKLLDDIIPEQLNLEYTLDDILCSNQERGTHLWTAWSMITGYVEYHVIVKSP